MKNIVIKFLIATLVLPVFLSILPHGVARDFHEIQHGSDRVAVAHPVEHPSGEHAPDGHHHSHDDQHPVFLDLNTYFSQYLNVDLRALPRRSVEVEKYSADIFPVLPPAIPYPLVGSYATEHCVVACQDKPLPALAVFSQTMRIRI